MDGADRERLLDPRDTDAISRSDPAGSVYTVYCVTVCLHFAIAGCQPRIPVPGSGWQCRRPIIERLKKGEAEGDPVGKLGSTGG